MGVVETVMRLLNELYCLGLNFEACLTLGCVLMMLGSNHV